MPEPVQWVEVPGWGKCVPLAEVQAIAERLDRERKARKAAEAVNAEEVLRRRTNLEARIEVAEIETDQVRTELEEERDEALAEVERLRERHSSSLEVEIAICPTCGRHIEWQGNDYGYLCEGPAAARHTETDAQIVRGTFTPTTQEEA